jgi:hypothetical protein
MRKQNLTITITLLAIVALVCLCGTASAGDVKGYSVTVTMDAGSSITSVVIPLAKSEIKDVYVWVPTLDSGDGTSITLRQTVLGVATVTPRGWTDKGVSGTGDNAIVLCNSSVLDVFCDGNVTVAFQTTTNQAADRTFKVTIFVRH